jgi:hypothetical protein
MIKRKPIPMEITFAGYKIGVSYVLLNQETSSLLADEPARG